MWGRKRAERRWADAATTYSMSVVDDPRPHLGVELSLLATELKTTFDAEETLGIGLPFLDETTTRTTQIVRSAVRTSMSGPGLLAVVMLDSEVRTTGWLSRRTTDLPPIQVIIGRLPRPIDSPIAAAPYYVPGDIVDSKVVAAVVERNLAPAPLDHGLLEHHWLSLSGHSHGETLAADPELCALLWAMRSKVSNERISSPGVAASLEQLISPVDRLTSFEAVEIRDDLVAVALQFPWPRSGFHGNAVQLIDHVTSRFPTS